MKKIIFIIIAIILASSFVLANIEHDNNKNLENSNGWSLRGDITESNIVNIKGVDVHMAEGKFSSYLSLNNKEQTQGSVTMSLWTFHGDEKFSIVWDTKRDRCDPTIQESTITIQAKVTYKRNVEYKIPITINYNKQSSTVDIIGPDFELRNIPVNDLNNPFHSDNGEPYEQPDETPSQDPPTSPSESHNVALVDFSNSINMMRLEETNGTDILGSDLMCNNKYKIWIKVENHGDFAENVTFTGNINGLTFNHLPKDDLTPGSSSQKSRTVQFSLPAGTHTISVEAHIPNDSNPSDNIAQRTINIICP